MELLIIVYLKTLFLSVDNMTLGSINSDQIDCCEY